MQFFADDGQGGEKTEEPTAKKLEDARKEGNVAKSREIANAFGILALFLVLKLWIGMIGEGFLELFPTLYDRIPSIAKLYGGCSPVLDMSGSIKEGMLILLKIIAPIFIVGFLVAFLCDYVQVKWKPTTKPLRPKFSKLNPVKGFKKIISANSLIELLKAIAKVGVIAIVTYNYVMDRQNFIYILYNMSLMQAISLIGDLVINLGIQIAAVYMVIAFIDFAYQKFKYKKDLKMTKQEIKEEYKNQEGNPEIKGKIRQKMREVSQRRMMQALPQADVVITNPTHYAVALKYNPDEAPAPIVVAKGADYLAKKIKEIAKENDIEIVENKPLARMLYANVEIDAQVPPELYQAVAEVLAFVYQVKGKI